MTSRFCFGLAAAASLLLFCIAGFAGVQTASNGTTNSAEPEERTSGFRMVVVESGESLQEAVCILCSIVVRGRVDGDVVAIWGGVQVEGTVTGDLIAVGGSVALGPHAVVKGEVLALGGRLGRTAGSTLEGDAEEFKYIALPGQRDLFYPGTLVFLLGNAIFCLLGFPLLRSRGVTKMAEAFRTHPWWSVAAGGIFLCVWAGLIAGASDLRRYEDVAEGILLIAILLAGIPACAAVSYILGRRLAPSVRAFAATLLGAAVLSIVCVVPVIGLLAFLMTWAIGIGVCVLSLFRLKSRKDTPHAPATSVVG